MMKRRYFLELGGSIAAYAIVLAVSLYLLNAGEPDASLRPIFSLLPMVPALTVCWVVIRQLRRVDEMQRKIQFEALGLAFAATALVTFSFGFLENAGFPKISMFAIWPLMAAFWMAGTIIGHLRYR